MIPKDGLDLQYLQGAFKRRFWYIVLPFFLISIGTVVYCIKTPRVYKATTLVLVEPQKVPGDYVKSTVSTEIGDRLRTIQEQVNSRTRLERIINQYDLYSKIRAEKTMTDAVETFRKNIEINVRRAGGRQSSAAFEIAFVSADGAKARDVTNSIANLFIEDNLKLREAQAMGTTKFLDRELVRMKDLLRQKEEQVRQFKEKYSGLLPEQAESNYRVLAQLQQQLDSINATIQRTEDRKLLVQTQIGRLESAQSHAITTRTAGQDLTAAPDQVSLTYEELRQQLASLRARYSDKHPDVIRLAAKIAHLEKEQSLFVPKTDSDSQADTVPSPTSEARRLILLQREDLLTQLKLIDKELGKLGKEKNKINRQIREYRQRIENGPKIEAMFVDLRRGYEEAKSSYQSLLEKKMQAQLSENLERAQQGEQFRILDPAKLPEKPFKPNPLKMLFLGFILAAGCGLGIAYLAEFLDPTFQRAKDLENFIQLPLLVSIPAVITDRERRRNMFKRIGATGALVSMAGILVYTLFVLWKMEPNSFPFLTG